MFLNPLRVVFAVALMAVASGAVALGVVALNVGPATAADEEPPLKGHFADNFSLLRPPVPAPEEAFSDGDGEALRLGDFAGRVVLVNFWATWCAPCVREMPSLDRLQAALGDQGLEVVAVSRDRGGRAVVDKFYQEHELTNLKTYLDPKGKFSRALGVKGLPTTFLVDGAGRLVGELRGAAEWDEAEAVELIHHYLKQLGPTPETEVLETSG